MAIEFLPQQSPIDLLAAENFYCEYPLGYLRLNWPAGTEGQLEGEGETGKYAFHGLSSDIGLTLALYPAATDVTSHDSAKTGAAG